MSSWSFLDPHHDTQQLAGSIIRIRWSPILRHNLGPQTRNGIRGWPYGFLKCLSWPSEGPRLHSAEVSVLLSLARHATTNKRHSKADMLLQTIKEICRTRRISADAGNESTQTPKKSAEEDISGCNQQLGIDRNHRTSIGLRHNREEGLPHLTRSTNEITN